MTAWPGWESTLIPLETDIKTGSRLLNEHLPITVKRLNPWCHWLVDDFLTQDCLQEVKSIDHALHQQNTGRRVGQGRLFVNHDNGAEYPCLYQLYCSLFDGFYRRYFEFHTGLSFQDLHPRVEVISDIGDFYLEPHPDQPEKKLTALVYTDFQQLYPGTQLSDGSHVPAKDNRCFFFVPAADTVHGYPQTTFNRVRRCLQINYWTYDV